MQKLPSVGKFHSALPAFRAMIPFLASLRLDVRGSDHFAPLLGLRRHIGAELRGGEDQRRGGRVGEPSLDDRVCETVVNLAVEPLGDLVWRTPRDADTLPRGRFEAGHDVAYRWDVGQSSKSGLASHGQSTQRT